jgi:hypothetical protein
MFATRNNSIWRRFQNFEQFAARKVLFLLGQTDADALAWQSKRDEDGAAIGETSHRVAAVGEFFELNVEG